MILRLLGAVALAASVASSAAAQCVGRPDFDACMASSLNRAQAQNNAAMMRTWQTYLRTNGAWLRQQYPRQHLPGQTFEQFAYNMIMSANGTNWASAQAAQQNAFRGRQQAYATVQQGNSDYRAGMYANSRTYSNLATNYSNQAIRGLAPYRGPNGSTVWIPNTSAPANQPFNYNGSTYMNTPQGALVFRNGGWQALAPR